MANKDQIRRILNESISQKESQRLVNEVVRRPDAFPDDFLIAIPDDFGEWVESTVGRGALKGMNLQDGTISLDGKAVQAQLGSPNLQVAEEDTIASLENFGVRSVNEVLAEPPGGAIVVYFN